MERPYHIDLKIDSVIFSAVCLEICLIVCGLYSLVKTRHHAAVYVINLFITDLIQTLAKIIQISEHLFCLKMSKCNYVLENNALLVYVIGVVINIFFMVCISAERYIMIAHPVWYRNSYKVRTSVYVSVSVWIIVAALTVIAHFFLTKHLFVGALLVMLFPYPFVIFFFVGTWRALPRNTSLTLNEQRWIMGTLGLVLFIYTVLFLPTVFDWLENASPNLLSATSWKYLGYSAKILLALNPLFDFVLYLIMRKDAKEIMSALFFCFHKRHTDSAIVDARVATELSVV